MKTKQTLRSVDTSGTTFRAPVWWRNPFKLLKRILAVGLTCSAMAGFVVPLAASDFKTQTATSKKAAPTTLTGRVIFVDKALRALAVEVKGQILQINVPSHLRILKGGKLVTLEELVAGQEITLTFKETVQGRLEVVSVNVDASPSRAEAAGSRPAGIGPPDPFPGSANPANLGGQIRSPNR